MLSPARLIDRGGGGGELACSGEGEMLAEGVRSGRGRGVKRWAAAFSRQGRRLQPGPARARVIIAVTLGAVGPRGERCLRHG